MPIHNVHIFDLDGTLVDSSHRYQTEVREDGSLGIDLEHWRANEHLCTEDSLLPLSEIYKEMLNSPTDYVIIATARVMCENCWKFIEENLGVPDHVVSRRGNNDSRGGVEMKLAGVRPLFNLTTFRNANVIVYEDNKDYLAGLCSALNARGAFFPSNQGY